MPEAPKVRSHINPKQIVHHTQPHTLSKIVGIHLYTLLFYDAFPDSEYNPEQFQAV
nr:hypothetical protein [uncultured Draconibacterium sp.]